MKETIYLVLRKKGVAPTVYKNPPPLKSGELWFKLNIGLPDSAFTIPPIEADLFITEDQFRNKKIEEFEFELKQLKESD